LAAESASALDLLSAMVQSQRALMPDVEMAGLDAMIMPATGATKGTLVTKAHPVCRAAREVSITPIAPSFPPPIEPDETESTPSAVTMAVRVSKRQENSNLPSLADRLTTFRGVRKYTTEIFPEGKMLSLLLYDFVVDLTVSAAAIDAEDTPHGRPWELKRDLF